MPPVVKTIAKKSKAPNATATTAASEPAPEVEETVPSTATSMDTEPTAGAPVKKASKKKKKDAEDTPAPVAPKKAEKVKPPRVKTARMYFAEELRATWSTEERKELGIGGQSKRISEAWAALEDKAKYETLEAQDRSEKAAQAPPKRAKSAYNNFITAKWAELKTAGGGDALPFKDQSKAFADMWKALDKDAQEAWKGGGAVAVA